MKYEDYEIEEIMRELEQELGLERPMPVINDIVVHEEKQSKLTRSKDRKVIGGVFSGLADYFNLSDFSLFIMRIVAVLMVLLGVGSPIVLYLVAWILMPKKKEDKNQPVPIQIPPTAQFKPALPNPETYIYVTTAPPRRFR